jgi:signal transduction histidine kinase
VKARVVIGAVVLLNVAGLVASYWLVSLPQREAVEAAVHAPQGAGGANLSIGWVLTGAVLAWCRPRNALGWLLLGAGSCGVLSTLTSLYGAYGVVLGDPDWPVARWSAWLGSGIWLPGALSLASVLIALYPAGRLPGPTWRWPLWVSVAGIAMVTAGFLLSSSSYDDVAPGPSPLSVTAPAWFSAAYGVLMAVLFLGGTLTIWVMSGVRLARAQSPERQQLAWLLAVVVLSVALFAVDPPMPQPLSWIVVSLIPAAVAVGVLRYELLGIELVVRRGLVYGALTAAVVSSYLLATLAASLGLGHGPIPAVVAAALVAVGLAPLRERLQRVVDRLVYGEGRDPMRAVTRLGDRVAGGSESDLLSAVLACVTSAVRAPGASVVVADGPPKSLGIAAPGLDLPLTVSGQAVGILQVAPRASGETYSAGDRRLLAALAPLVAVVVRALDLAEELEDQRDRVLAAARTERDRLRRDLHDGLGPSLSGVGLSLRAVDDALRCGDQLTARRLNNRTFDEVRMAVGEVRRILDDLRPGALAEDGLAGAVRRHAAIAVTGCPVQVTVCQDLPKLHPAVETAAFRITQEALTNATRHAQASSVRVAIDADRDTLRVHIDDDGKGCQPGVENGSGIGLKSMRQRAEALGGTLSLHSAPGGTSVTATLPLQPT